MYVYFNATRNLNNVFAQNDLPFWTTRLLARIWNNKENLIKQSEKEKVDGTL